MANGRVENYRRLGSVLYVRFFEHNVQADA